MALCVHIYVSLLPWRAQFLLRHGAEVSVSPPPWRSDVRPWRVQDAVRRAWKALLACTSEPSYVPAQRTAASCRAVALAPAGRAGWPGGSLAAVAAALAAAAAWMRGVWRAVVG